MSATLTVYLRNGLVFDLYRDDVAPAQHDAQLRERDRLDRVRVRHDETPATQRARVRRRAI